MSTLIPSDFRTLPTPESFIPRAPPALAYSQSSQFQNWRFTQHQLDTLREGANQGARRRVAEAWSAANGKGKERARDDGEEDHDGAQSEDPSSSKTPINLPFPTVSDELELIKFYLGKVPGLTRALTLPEFVGAAAMTYMKRFYLRNSCLEWHPKHIMLTCLFLATKTENVPMSLHTFASKVGGKSPTREAVDESARSIREHEFLVSQSLQFEFMVWGTGRALAGLLTDIQLLEPPLPPAKYHELTQAAQEPLALSRLTDAEFLFTPAQIALTCLRAAEAKVLSPEETKWGIGQLGSSLTKPYLSEKERRARDAAEEGKRERDALRKVDEDRLKSFLPSSSTPKTAQVGAEGVPQVNGEGSTPTPAPPHTEDNPALALSHTDGSLLAVLDRCAAMIQAEAERKSAPGSTAAAERMEKVKAVDRDIKACKASSSSAEVSSEENGGSHHQTGKKRAAPEEEPKADDVGGKVESGEGEEPAQKRARTGGSG
ncbi:hypothetical protein CF319_g5570 [Tilletia indica]|nr:hypothetical protein CF319_g5570 [Tilletia indica]